MSDLRSLLASVDLVAVVQSYTPLKRSAAGEYVGRCLWHAPDDHPSMRVVPSKGFCYCFSCGGHGDALDVVRHVEGLSFREGLERLRVNGWERAPIRDIRPYKGPQVRVTGKPPSGTSQPRMALRELGEPTEIRPIRDAAGDVLGYECRYPRVNGKSPSRVWSWAFRRGEWGWNCGVFADPRPLYGLERLAARPEAPVVVTEGPKKADAAGVLMPRYAGVSWTGGCMAWHRHELEPLRGRTLVLWPDADDEREVKGRMVRAGVEAMDKLAIVLADGLGCAVRVIDPVNGPDGKGGGWDAADALAEGWDWTRVQAWAKGRVRTWRATA